MLEQHLPPEIRATLKQYRRDARQAAAAFAHVCAEGDADKLYNASLWLDETVGGWRLAMVKVGKLQSVSREIQDAFLPIWVEHKHAALSVGDRPVMAKALHVLMPAGYTGPALTLYRGTRASERTRRLYGFSWSTEIASARRFAEVYNNSDLEKPVVLRTEAPAEAILLIRERFPDYYDEGEVVVDPYHLGRVEVV
jgi:hypothetical protein